jgi:hypothetical protein
VISNEISFSIGKLLKYSKVFYDCISGLAIAYCNVFEGLPLRGNLDVDNEPVQFWYSSLWKHKAPFHFFLIQDKFLKEFRYILTGVEPRRITQEDEDFLKGKGICVQEENHTYIKLYGCEENPLLLPIFVCDKIFCSQKSVDNIRHGVFYLIEKERNNSLHYLFMWEIQ